MESKFQQRHYEAIAKVLSENKDNPVDDVVFGLVSMFKADNPNFQETTFLKAVYGE